MPVSKDSKPDEQNIHMPEKLLSKSKESEGRDELD